MSGMWFITPDGTKLPLEKARPALEKENQVLAKTLYLSNGPAQRGWIQKGVNPARLYVPPVEQDAPMGAYGIAEVIESTSSKFPKGSLITGKVNWSEHKVFNEAECNPIRKVDDLSETHFLGALGLIGVTAWWGLHVVRTNADDKTVVVSGAAGATGSMVVQIAKHILGVKRVVGISGSDDKCKWVETLGADVCLNYKSPSFKKDLKAATEGFVEVYFDNVGGEILDLMLGRMARFGRIAACGAISGYNNHSEPYGIKSWSEIITQRIEIKGFICLDAGAQMPKIIEDLTQAYKDGKIQIGAENETIIAGGFEDIPKTWLKLFSGANTGKLVTKIV
ncbi:hypothetical protein BDV97DRAFT_384605 [Delphinella strobiligena]|nr:hypothetical protein BDV97DRAFT_384605 [Delphinella strobiligena]